jgi:beta-phosphoglucomutase family hydrolase
MRFDGLIFDLDGVLVDTVPVQIEVWSETFAQFGYDFDEAAYRLLVDGRPALDGARAVMQGASSDLVDQAVRIKEQAYLARIDAGALRVFESSRKFIEACRQQDYRMAVASSSDHARHVLELAGPSLHFEHVICGSDVAHGKPAPDIFLAAAAHLGLPAWNCVVFEDSSAGVSAAKAGGFYCIGIAKNCESWRLDAADEVVASFDHLGTGWR